MKLTLEDSPERLKRFSHIKPAPKRRSVLCEVKCPGTLRTCTRERGHSGPHVAHGRFKRVVAAWESGVDVTKFDGRARRPVPPPVRAPDQGGQAKVAWKAFREWAVRRWERLDELLLFILAMSMAGFAIDWFLRAVGLY